jgi:2-phosphosulfolactate phosphatase
MQVQLLDFVAGARAARGVAVVIDVFRAFTVACHAIAQGAERVVPMDDADEVLAVKRAQPGYLTIGERLGRKIAGFDCNNSPSEIESLALAGRTVVQTTSAGTRGLVNATGADVVLTGALVNAAAICRYIRELAPATVSLVRMGVAARERSDADDLCADLIAGRLLGRPFEEQGIRERLRESPEALKFFDPAAHWAPERDFELCTRLDRFPFVLRLTPEPDGLRALRWVPVQLGSPRP